MGTPQLNIKDAEATRLARELAELTGEFRPKSSAKPCGSVLNARRRDARPTMPVQKRTSAANSKGFGPRLRKFRIAFESGDWAKIISLKKTSMTRTDYRNNGR